MQERAVMVDRGKRAKARRLIIHIMLFCCSVVLLFCCSVVLGFASKIPIAETLSPASKIKMTEHVLRSSDLWGRNGSLRRCCRCSGDVFESLLFCGCDCLRGVTRDGKGWSRW